MGETLDVIFSQLLSIILELQGGFCVVADDEFAVNSRAQIRSVRDDDHRLVSPVNLFCLPLYAAGEPAGYTVRRK